MVSNPSPAAATQSSPQAVSSKAGIPIAKERTLKEQLARYMDPQAFDPLPPQTKRTSPQFAKVLHDRRKRRRRLAMERAASALAFFSRAENRRKLEARSQAILQSEITKS